MPVHHIDVDPINATDLAGVDLVFEMGKIS
jgi:hypothetical protein